MGNRKQAPCCLCGFIVCFSFIYLFFLVLKHLASFIFLVINCQGREEDLFTQPCALFSFLNYPFVFMCVVILSSYRTVHHICAWDLWKPEEGFMSWNWSYRQLKAAEWELGIKASGRASSAFSH